MNDFDAKTVLDQLDDCNESYTFPVLDNGYIYPVDSRLSVYRDKKRWAILFEIIGFSHRSGNHEGVENTLYCFGNCLASEPGLDNNNFLNMTADDKGVETFIFPDDAYESLNPKASSILVRGQSFPVSHDPKFYEAKGVEFEEPPHIYVWEFLRGFVPEHRELFLASEEEIHKRIPKDLPLLLRLNEWYHGEPIDSENDQKKPSEIETFQMIAKMIESGNVEDYKPTQASNNHWKNWSEGGKS